jgi:phosphohistidine phosphatase
MHIWLARHGEAASVEGSGTDFDRRLTDAGRHQVAQLGRWLKDHEPPPELILHSPLKRAAETAGILRDELGPNIRCEESHTLSPGMRCDLLLARLATQTAQTVLCVGHQPDIGRCLAEMLGGGRFLISPGTIAGVEFPHIITPGGGQLQWLLDPEWF